MTRDDVLHRLRALKPWLAEQGVTRLRLFGSFAHDTANEDSDIDLLVDFETPPGLSFFTLQEQLAERLGRPVELCTADALHRLVREQATAEAVLV